MRRILSLTLAVIVAGSLVPGCGPDEGAVEPTAFEPNPTEEPSLGGKAGKPGKPGNKPGTSEPPTAE